VHDWGPERVKQIAFVLPEFSATVIRRSNSRVEDVEVDWLAHRMTDLLI